MVKLNITIQGMSNASVKVAESQVKDHMEQISTKGLYFTNKETGKKGMVPPHRILLIEEE